MTAAEKRAEFADRLDVLLKRAVSKTKPTWEQLTAIADLLTFADDEPAPAQKPDWRDEVVGWGTGWEKAGMHSAVKRIDPGYWQVFQDGSTGLYEAVSERDLLSGTGHGNKNPVARCRAIDRFLSELAGEGVS